jgi:hypothetical protein
MHDKLTTAANNRLSNLVLCVEASTKDIELLKTIAVKKIQNSNPSSNK